MKTAQQPNSPTLLAPIVLFVYNRPEHTLKTLEALKNNTLANESILYIFSDGFKENVVDFDKEKIIKTRSVIKSEQWCKEVIISESVKNKGLAASIIDGVTHIVKKHGKIIVLEDDIVTSKYFLQYMNDALNLYSNQKKVWHIAGYSTPINKKWIEQTYFSRYMACWGWGTWNDRWEYYQKNTDELLSLFTKAMKHEFNYGKKNEFWGQIEANKTGRINTWAVYWYATIFTHQGLCLNPRESLVRNIGMDGSGVHCGTTKVYEVILSDEYPIRFEMNIEELSQSRRKLYKYFSKGENKIINIFNNVFYKLRSKGIFFTINYYIEKYIKGKKNGT